MEIPKPEKPMYRGGYVRKACFGSPRETRDVEMLTILQDNLRYAFSTCVYGYPGSQGNTSTPCLVSCQPMFSAIEYDLQSPNSVTFDTFCGVPSFADNLIDMCEFCYSLTSTQRFLANCSSTLRYTLFSTVSDG